MNLDGETIKSLIDNTIRSLVRYKLAQIIRDKSQSPEDLGKAISELYEARDSFVDYYNRLMQFIDFWKIEDLEVGDKIVFDVDGNLNVETVTRIDDTYNHVYTKESPYSHHAGYMMAKHTLFYNSPEIMECIEILNDSKIRNFTHYIEIVNNIKKLLNK